MKTLIVVLSVLFILILFLRPLWQWFFPIRDPFRYRRKALFQETKYYRQYVNLFQEVCDKSGMNPDKIKVYILFSEDEFTFEINAAAWQTIRTKDTIYIEEGIFRLNHPDLVAVAIAHEISHIKHKDALFKLLITEYGSLVVMNGILTLLCLITILGTAILPLFSYLPELLQVLLLLVFTPFYIIMLLIIMVILVTSIITNSLIPTCLHHCAEIRADVFAAKICGVASVNKLLTIAEEIEKKMLLKQPLLCKLKLIYNYRLMDHPTPSFRKREVVALRKVDIFYTIKHYFRLIIWLITLRGFYGEYIIRTHNGSETA